MRLFIGKNHDGKVASAPVQSIFRLTGNNEDALTYPQSTEGMSVPAC